MAGQPEQRLVEIGIILVSAQFEGVLFLRKVARTLAAHVNADARVKGGAADHATGARLGSNT